MPNDNLNERLIDLQEQLEFGLKKGAQYLEWFSTLNTTNDVHQLLNVSNNLANTVVDSESVKFPQKFEASDYYLIFMHRLSQLGYLKTEINLEILNHDGNQVAYQYFNDDSQTQFRFYLADGIAEFLNCETQQIIFYMDLNQKSLYFDTTTLNARYLIDENAQEENRLKELNGIIEFGQLMEHEFHFNVDFNMFDIQNIKEYNVQPGTPPEFVTDELFVEAVNNNYILMQDVNRQGAILNLSDDLEFELFKNNNADKWAIKVQDKAESMGLYDVLLKYPFLKDWYLKHLNYLKIDNTKGTSNNGLG